MDELPAVTINIEPVQVGPTTRKLKVRWGPGTILDVYVFLGLESFLRRLQKAGLKLSYKLSRA